LFGIGTKAAVATPVEALASGPKGRIFLGTLPEFNRDPLGFLTRCALEYGDVVRVRFLHVPVYLISRPDLIESVLVTQSADFRKSIDLRETRLLLGNGLLTSEGEFWRRQRRLIHPAFHRESIAAYAGVMTNYAERMLGKWMDGQTRELHHDMMRLTLEIVAKCLFDAEVTDEVQAVDAALRAMLEQFQKRSMTGYLMPVYVPTTGNLQALMAIRRLDQIVYRILRQRRASRRHRSDLLSRLLEARDEDGRRMTNRQLRDEVMTLLLAGHETTAIALSWTCYLLGKHPAVEAKLLAELNATLAGRAPTLEDLPRLHYTDKVVTESLRLYPPAWVIGREALRDSTIAGYHLPAGTTVYMSPWVVHRDPRFYDQPDKFQPGRWTDAFAARLPKFAYFPFGGGPRVCIGASFAKMEAVLLLATIAQKFRLTLAPGPAVEPWPSFTLRPRKGIHVVVTRR